MSSCSRFRQLLLAVFSVFVISGCETQYHFIEKDHRFDSEDRVGLVRFPESELAVVPVDDFEKAFPDHKGKDKSDLVLDLFSQAFSEPVRPFTYSGIVDVSSDSGIQFFKKRINDKQVRVRVVDVRNEISHALYINNVTFRYAKSSSSGSALVSYSSGGTGNMTNSYGVRNDLYLSFDYVLKDIDEKRIISYGYIDTSVGVNFGKDESRWRKVVKKAMNSLMEKIVQ